ncbi:MAG TPA: restriction endonuclease subunit S [Blastocatellia bacterium]|jgi:type I restriction enzyme S subunit|nr:restriction endonuclease subunit S [Blastocatellia bacterium]
MVSDEGEKLVRLRDCGDLRNGINFNRTQEGAGLPVLKVKDFGDHFFVPADGLDELDSERISVPPEQYLEEGDTVIIRSNGNGQLVGRCLYVHSLKRPTTFSGFCIRFRPNPKIIHPGFASYFLRSPISRQRFVAYGSGTGIQNLNQATIGNVELILPSLDEQRAIARVLSALVDKIELNRQTSHTLEAMARALFKSWLVDFDPVTEKATGRKPYGMNEETALLFPSAFEGSGLEAIPKGWKVKPLDEIANYENGLALQKFRPTGYKYLAVIKIRELRQGYSDSTSDKASPNIKSPFIVHDGDIIFSWSGSLLVEIWCGGEGALNQHLFKVTSANYPKWFYYFWTKEHLEDFQDIASGKATTMGHIQRHHLSAALSVVPSSECLERADKIIAPMIEAIVNNRTQSRALAALRDSLLPRLLSGEIRVRQAEKTLAETI